MDDISFRTEEEYQAALNRADELLAQSPDNPSEEFKRLAWMIDNWEKGVRMCPQKTEVYSRVCGYLRPVQQWNPGKKQEFKQRKEFQQPNLADPVLIDKLNKQIERRFGSF